MESTCTSVVGVSSTVETCYRPLDTLSAIVLFMIITVSVGFAAFKILLR